MPDPVREGGEERVTMPEWTIGRDYVRWIRDPETECWNWTGPVSAKGYGRGAYKGRSMGAHRAAWSFAHGPIPDGMAVHHCCENKLCGNPDHLELLEFVEHCYRHRKLTPTDIRTIRTLYAKGKHAPHPGSTRGLAERFGVSIWLVTQIRRGNCYQWVK